jgi:mono/diheme cytochrome c family protein
VHSEKGNPDTVPPLLRDIVRNQTSSGGSKTMKHLSVRVVLVSLLASGVIAICSSTAMAQDAAATYKAKCAMCHGPDGKGSTMGVKMGAHDFTSADVQKQSDAQLTAIITNGKGKMPAYSGKLKDSDIAGLVAYIRTLK